MQQQYQQQLRQQEFDRNQEMARNAAQQQMPAQPQMYWVNNYWSIATHADAKDVWIVTGYLNDNDARSAALATCRREMGEGCQAYSGWNNSITAVRTGDGDTYWVADASAGKSKSGAASWCRENERDCETLATVTATPWLLPNGSAARERVQTYFPSHASAAQRITAVAFPEKGDVWIATGAASSEQAKKLVADKCRNAGGECKSVFVLLDAWAVQYSRSDGTEYWRSGRTEAAARQSIASLCRKQHLTCVVSRVFDPATKRLENVPLPQGALPLFASTAWIKGDAEAWNKMVWISAGNTSEDQSKSKAIALCQTATSLPCDSTFTASNHYVIIYRDDNNNIRTSARPTDQEARDYAKEACKKAGVKCSVAGVFSSRLAGGYTIDTTIPERR